MCPDTTALDDRPKARILIIEDEPVLAVTLEDSLIDAGFAIAGVAGRLEMALAMIERGDCDAAILDANLAAVSAAPVATALTARRVPFVVVSGYGPAQLGGAFSRAIYLKKPYRLEQLVQALNGVLNGQHATAARLDTPSQTHPSHDREAR